ncbi:DNA primase [archaeon]|nr:DNA primase [archaeon]
MGKTYLTAIKYMIKGTITIDGIVEKPDVVGAIFGQTEGLLGDEMDLRELQKSGRIGRIEVDIKTKTGKSTGDVTLSSSLDKFQTATLAAALETVDRVGPCEAHIDITSIEDTRAEKRDFVMGRAQELLSKLGSGTTPESKEISSKLRSAVRTAKVSSYGPEKIACGPSIEKQAEIIVVEGRADVLNLLSYGITNVIAMQGSIIPKSVAELSKRKITTLFVDGDRGGDIAIKQLAQAGKVDFVAKAPDGKEVEELTQKEILKQLKNKISYTAHRPPTRKTTHARPTHGRRPIRTTRTTRTTRDIRPTRDSRPTYSRVDPKLEKTYKEIQGTMKAALVEGTKISKVGVAEMINEIKKKNKLDAVVFDGIITQRLVELAETKGVKTLVGLKKAKLERKGKVNVYAMN